MGKSFVATYDVRFDGGNAERRVKVGFELGHLVLVLFAGAPRFGRLEDHSIRFHPVVDRIFRLDTC